jgi:uncharacterized membrane protein YccC
VVARLEEARVMATVARWIRMTTAATPRRARERVAGILIGITAVAGIMFVQLTLSKLLVGWHELGEMAS